MKKYLFLILLSFGIFQTQAGAQETVTSLGSSVIPAPVGEGEYTLHIRSGFISLAGRFVKS